MAELVELAETMARRAVDRTVADRQAAYATAIRDVVDATYRLIEETGQVDVSLREILRATGLSTQAFYRYFRSKDELFLLLLDDGRRRLVGYLEHRMAKASTPAGQVREWVAGVLAQASRDDVAHRTRPFVVHQERLTQLFPEEQRVSVDLLVDLLRGPVAALGGDAELDSLAVYRLTFATLSALLAEGRAASGREVDHVVAFCTSGIGRGRGRRDDG